MKKKTVFWGKVPLAFAWKGFFSGEVPGGCTIWTPRSLYFRGWLDQDFASGESQIHRLEFSFLQVLF